MAQINWGRLLVGSLIAAIIMFVTDGLIHEMLAKADWHALYEALGAREPEPHGANMVYFAIFELGRGFTALMFYVLMRPFFGAGPKTAVTAGVVGWIAFSLTGPVQFIPLGFFSTALWLKVGALHFIVSIVATIAGAALYKTPGRQLAGKQPMKIRALRVYPWLILLVCLTAPIIAVLSSKINSSLVFAAG
jgi:hypothetical protein